MKRTMIAVFTLVGFTVLTALPASLSVAGDKTKTETKTESTTNPDGSKTEKRTETTKMNGKKTKKTTETKTDSQGRTTTKTDIDK